VNLTQARFAEKLGVSIPAIARWENNRSQPSPLVLMQLKTMLYELKESPHKLQHTRAQALLIGYFNESL
jgi:putative transcriptional regulator